MPIPCNALILSLEPSGEAFIKLTGLSQETGAFYCLKRIPRKKSAASPAPDLFDTAAIHLEASKQGGVLFVRDYQLVCRRDAIGQNYQKLKAASAFCGLLARNAPYMTDPGKLYALTERSLDAFAERLVPEIVLLKGLYLLLRDEGYPVRESWWPRLPASLKEPVQSLLNQPTPHQADAAVRQACRIATENLREWMRQETDFILQQETDGKKA